MVARVLFPVLTCGGTRSHPQHRATIKALAPTESWARALVDSVYVHCRVRYIMLGYWPAVRSASACTCRNLS